MRSTHVASPVVSTPEFQARGYGVASKQEVAELEGEIERLSRGYGVASKQEVAELEGEIERLRGAGEAALEHCERVEADMNEEKRRREVADEEVEQGLRVVKGLESEISKLRLGMVAGEKEEEGVAGLEETTQRHLEKVTELNKMIQEVSQKAA